MDAIVKDNSWAKKFFGVIEPVVIGEVEDKPKDVGTLIADFVHLRDTLAEERKLFKQREEDIKLELEQLQALILAKQKELGVTSLSTKEFTAFQTTKTYVRMSDWDTFSKWVLDTGNIHCVEKRCAKLACQELGINLSTIGLDAGSEIEVQVRRISTKGGK